MAHIGKFVNQKGRIISPPSAAQPQIQKGNVNIQKMPPTIAPIIAITIQSTINATSLI